MIWMKTKKNNIAEFEMLSCVPNLAKRNQNKVDIL